MAHPKNFISNTSGVAAIEFALILPVLLLILLGVIEFGVYFMKEQIVQRTESTTAAAIQQDPSDASTEMGALGSGAGLVDYSATGNYICAKSYTVAQDAKNLLCAAGDWATTAPTTTDYIPGTAYYVALVSFVQESSFTAMFRNFIPAIKVTSVFKVGGGGSSSVTMGTVHQPKTSSVDYKNKTFNFTLAGAGTQNVTLTGVYFTCSGLPVSLYVDSTLVDTFGDAGYDTDGCDQNTIVKTFALSPGTHTAYFAMAVNGHNDPISETFLSWIATPQ